MRGDFRLKTLHPLCENRTIGIESRHTGPFDFQVAKDMAILKSEKRTGDAFHTHKERNNTVPKPAVLRTAVDPKRRARPGQAESSKEGDAPVASNANSNQGGANHQPHDDLINTQRPETARTTLSSATSAASSRVAFVDSPPNDSPAVARNSRAPCPKTPNSAHDDIAALTKTPPVQHRRTASAVRTTHEPRNEWNTAQQRSRDSSVATTIVSSPRLNTRDIQSQSQVNNTTANPSPISPHALRRSSMRRSSIGLPGRHPYQYDEESGNMEDDRDRTLKRLEGERDEGVRIAQEDDQKTEDLFLNLAQDDTARRMSQIGDRAERRKVRTSLLLSHCS